MTVQVRLFAAARQLAQCELLELDLPPAATVAELRAALGRRVPALEQLLPHVLFAVNAEYASDQTRIPEAAELACIPPVSGG